MTTPRNAGDIPTEPIILLMGTREDAGEPWTQFGHTCEDGDRIPGVRGAMPEGTPETVIRAKMRRLYRKGLVDGCLCGCRGDFTLTEAGRDLYAQILVERWMRGPSSPPWSSPDADPLEDMRSTFEESRRAWLSS